MPMRLELGAFSLEVERQEDAADFLRGLSRHLNNQEVGELLGITDKTVRRWRRLGRLPGGDGGQVTLLSLLQHLTARPAAAVGSAVGSAAASAVSSAAGAAAAALQPRPPAEGEP